MKNNINDEHNKILGLASCKCWLPNCPHRSFPVSSGLLSLLHSIFYLFYSIINAQESLSGSCVALSQMLSWYFWQWGLRRGHIGCHVLPHTQRQRHKRSNPTHVFLVVGHFGLVLYVSTLALAASLRRAGTQWKTAICLGWALVLLAAVVLCGTKHFLFWVFSMHRNGVQKA